MTKLFGVFCFVCLYIVLPFVTSAGEDDSKTTDTLRVISLAPNITEMIYALGAQDALIGVTDYCVYPPEAQEKVRLGGHFNPNREKIISMQPDFVFSAPSRRDLEANLETTGIKVVFLPNSKISDILESIKTLGEQLGVPERAEELVDEIKGGLDELKQKSPEERPSILYILGHPPGVLREIYAAGPNTFLDEMIEAAGGRNVLYDSEVEYPLVSREVMIRRVPDIVIDTKPDGKWSAKEKGQMRMAWMEYLGPGAESSSSTILISRCLDRQLRKAPPDLRSLSINRSIFI